MRIIKKVLVIILIFMAIVATCIGMLVYEIDYAKHEVETSSSDNGQHSLTIYQIGDADWPFGATHCRLDLYKEKSLIKKYSFDLSNDGKIVDKNNFDISWQEGSVTVLAMAEEQTDVYYQISFDGKVET